MTEEERTVLVVGASSDIGCALLSKLDGRYVTAFAHCHRSAAKLQALATRLQALPLRILQADLGSDADLGRLLQEVRAAAATPDALVFLAAPKFRLKRFSDVAWPDFQREIAIQLAPTVALLEEFLPAMAKRGRGKVVFVLSSVTEGVPPIGLSPYVTVKQALLGLMRSVAAEYSGRHLNINAVSPSMTQTAFLEELPERMVEIAAEQSPWRRNATPQDVAGAISFLLSSEADYITGVNLLVSGGTVF